MAQLRSSASVSCVNPLYTYRPGDGVLIMSRWGCIKISTHGTARRDFGIPFEQSRFYLRRQSFKPAELAAGPTRFRSLDSVLRRRRWDVPGRVRVLPAPQGCEVPEPALLLPAMAGATRRL